MCNKMAFESKREAKSYAKHLKASRKRFTKQTAAARSGNGGKGERLWPYECPQCAQWHLTSMHPSKQKRYTNH